MPRFPSPDDKMSLLCLERGDGQRGVTGNWWDFYCLKNAAALNRIIKRFANHNSLEAINQVCLCCEMSVDSLLT